MEQGQSSEGRGSGEGQGSSSADEGVPQQPIDNIALRNLCTLLKSKAEELLNGQVSFCVTTEVLTRLAHDCRRHSLKQREEEDSLDDSSNGQSRPVSFGLLKKKDSSQEEWKESVQFIKDFMLSVPGAKIIHNHGTISFPISLHRFGNLSSLELRRIPIHLVEGLHTLRGQLKSLVSNRCILKPKDLLESCGGDRSAPLSWQQLKCVAVVFANVRQLDDSLRLLPDAEIVNLSHNQLETCDKFLELLSDVSFINLAYNTLTSVPSFSVNTRTTLTSLNLRGNHLDNVQGVEEATALQYLDLGENYMVKHSVLYPLKALPCLKQLFLDGNPLYFHKQHRTNTISCLAYRVVTVQFILDGKKLKKNEIMRYRPPKPTEQRTFLATYPPQPVSLSINADPGSLSSSSGQSLFTPCRKGKRRKIKARDTEIRDTTYDYSSGPDYTPVASPGMKFLEEHMDAKRQEALETKREIELLKEQYGPNYLQAIEDRKLFCQTPTDTASDSALSNGAKPKSKKHKKNLSGKFKKKALESSMESDMTENLLKNNSEAEAPGGTVSNEQNGCQPDNTQNLDDVDNRLAPAGESIQPENAASAVADSEVVSTFNDPVSNPIMAAIERMALGLSSDESVVERNASTRRGSVGFCSSEAEEKMSKEIFQNTEAGKDRNRIDAANSSDPYPEGASPSAGNPSKDRPVDMQTTPEANTPVQNLSQSGSRTVLSSLSPISSGDTSKSSSFVQSPERSTSEMDTSTDNSLQLSENEQESEPVFVTLPEDKDNKMIIVTFTDLFLVEKDVRGKITEKLDLRSLNSLETKKLRKKSSSDDFQDSIGWTSDNVAPKLDKDTKVKELALRLKFDYIRKDRQKRCYLVEVHDGKKMLSHIQPFLDLKAAREKAKDSAIMQCLKCNKTFCKKDLHKKSQVLPRSGSSKDFHSMKVMSENPSFICPACGSSIIIEIEPDSDILTESSNVSTPVGSHQSSGGFLESALSSQKSQKPAPLLRNRSFDSQSPHAKLASKLSARKHSISSIDSDRSLRRTGSGSGSVKSLSLMGSSPQTNQSARAGLLEPRERSNAFKAFSTTPQMSQSAFLPSTEIPLESEEMTYVEDHFTVDKMKDVTLSQELAFMTTSLRGDASTKGRHATNVYRPSRALDRDRELMEDSGFDSGVQLSGSSNLASQDARSEAGSDGSRTGGNSETAKGVETSQGQSLSSSVARDIPGGHHLYTSVEECVSSLLREGEEREKQEQSLGSCQRRSSISVADLKKLVSTSVSSRKSVSDFNSDKERASPVLRNSGSGSSIAILPNNGNDNVSSDAQGGSSGSTPVHFMVGSVEKNENGPTAEKSSSDLIRVSSPLNSNICSSMVSSVYETSVASNEKESECADKVEPVPLGSSESGKSRASEEDMTSIYDQPSNLNSGSVRSKRRRKRDKKSSSKSSNAQEEKRNSPSTYMDLIDRISPLNDSTAKQHKSSTSSNEDVGAGAFFLARSPDANDDADNESIGFNVDADILEAETMYRFDHLNHRLTLYLMMSLFDNDEEFKCKIQAETTQYIVQDTYTGILVMTTQRFYVLKITSDDHSKEPEEWLTCIEVQPIPELRYIEVGLGGQSLRIEFMTDCSSYTFVTMDKEKTMQFVDILHNELAHYAVSRGIASKVVVHEDVDQGTLDNLDKEVLSKKNSQQKLLSYCMGFIERGNQKLFPISFVVSTNSICLVRTNHQWPQPRLQGPITIETVGKQFTVLERQNINNIASVEICEVTLRKVKVELFNEKEGVSSYWHITMTNRQNAVSFIHALSEPWAKEFGIEMEITYSELQF